MGKKKLLDCGAMIIMLMLCIGYRVILMKKLPGKISEELIEFLDSTTKTAKKFMNELDAS